MHEVLKRRETSELVQDPHKGLKLSWKGKLQDCVQFKQLPCICLENNYQIFKNSRLEIKDLKQIHFASYT